MKHRSSTAILWRLIPAFLLPLFAGCSSLFEAKPDSTRFYLLTTPASVAVPAAEAGRTATVGLKRIELPAYLRTPGIVLRPGGTELRHAPAAHWAEALELGIARVLKESLQAQPPVRSVVAYPAPEAELPAYEVSVSVRACEGLTGPAGRGIRFVATWEFRSTAASAVAAAPLATGNFESAPAEWAEGDYATLTAKLGEAVAALAREIAAALPK